MTEIAGNVVVMAESVSDKGIFGGVFFFLFQTKDFMGYTSLSSASA
jgi:hypothetical protein